MPAGQVETVGETPVRTAARQPFVSVFFVRRQYQAVRDLLRTIRIIRAAAGIDIEQAAGNVGIEDVITVLILHLVHATKPTAVAQRLPLVGRHLGQRFAFPELIVHRFESDRGYLNFP